MSLGPKRDPIYYYCHVGKCPNNSSDCVAIIYAIQGGLYELEPKELEPQQVQLGALYGPCQVMFS